MHNACHRYPKFEPNINHIKYAVDGKTMNNVTVSCKHKDLCDFLIKYLAENTEQ